MVGNGPAAFSLPTCAVMAVTKLFVRPCLDDTCGHRMPFLFGHHYHQRARYSTFEFWWTFHLMDMGETSNLMMTMMGSYVPVVSRMKSKQGT
jgi:hypothetical protein